MSALALIDNAPIAAPVAILIPEDISGFRKAQVEPLILILFKEVQSVQPWQVDRISKLHDICGFDKDLYPMLEVYFPIRDPEYPSGEKLMIPATLPTKFPMDRMERLLHAISELGWQIMLPETPITPGYMQNILDTVFNKKRRGKK